MVESGVTTIALAPMRLRSRPVLSIVLFALTLALGALVFVSVERTGSRSASAEPSPRSSEFAGLTRSVDAVLVGDSLTERGRWHERLDYRFANRGIGRDTIAMVSARVHTLPPGPVFVLAGSNDLVRGHSLEDMRDDFMVLLDRLENRQVILQTVPTADPLLARDWNETVREVAAQRGHRLLDLERLLQPSDFMSDGIHLNAAGYRKWAVALGEMMRSLSGPATSSKTT